MPDTRKSTTQVGWIMLSHKDLLIRMNVQTGKTWELKSGVWLPVKESE